MEPLWKINGMKSQAEAFQKVFTTLLEDQKTIISKGFSEELQIGTVDGSYTILLKGKIGKKNEKKSN